MNSLNVSKAPHLRPTGKAYWIGYTDDMYSIAAHNDAAIPPLLELIEQTKNPKAAYGAVLTIHLIGIERTVKGRFYEEFKNKKARAALLSRSASSLLPRAIFT